MSDNLFDLRPFRMLNKLEKKLKDIWPIVDGAVLSRLKQKNTKVQWPSWCFLPFPHWEGILKYAESKRMIPGLSFKELLYYSSVGTWRYFQGYYDFDEELYNELISEPLDENIPSTILMNLPEICIYINTPWGIQFLTEPIYGFWVYVHYSCGINSAFETELYLIVDDQRNTYAMALFPIGNWSLKEGRNICTSLNTQFINKSVNDARLDCSGDMLKVAFESSMSFIISALPLILYLCSDNRELFNDKYNLRCPLAPDHLKPTSRKFRISPPTPKIWNIGRNVGKIIRDTQNSLKNADPSTEGNMSRAQWKYSSRGTPETDQEYRLEWFPPGMNSVATAQ
jgi:hypothetical protein